MSADNWTVCPRCEADKAQRVAESHEHLIASYGKVSAEEYATLQEAYERRKDAFEYSRETTLGEYYSIGISSEEFYVNYKARCVICGFEYEYKHRESVK